MIQLVKYLAAYIDKGDIPNIPNLDKGVSAQTITDVLHVVFGFAGAIALLIIMRASFRYVTSQGEPQSIKKNKDAILYALAGLVVAIIAFNLVTFVIEKVK